MFSKFLSLDSEKQDRIINAAMKEFAEKGFDRASTNEIVKEAEISKGLLFHYFSNKKQLFLFLYDYGVDLITHEIYKKFNLDENDLFARLRQISWLKFEVLNKYPEMFRFLEDAYLETSSSVRHELDDRKKEAMGNNLERLLEGVDFSKFKEGLDVKKALKIIVWTFEGFGLEELAKAKAQSQNPIDESMFAEADTYIELFKECFYK